MIIAVLIGRNDCAIKVRDCSKMRRRFPACCYLDLRSLMQLACDFVGSGFDILRSVELQDCKAYSIFKITWALAHKIALPFSSLA